jgi:hypothetical protein
MNEKMEQMKEKMDLEYVLPPIEILSGRAFLEFEVKEKGKKRSRKTPMLLSRCPFCGKSYDEKQLSALDTVD